MFYVWYAMDQWINNFANRIEIKATLFILGTGMSLLVALISVGYQAYKAVTASPIICLKDE